MVGVAGVGKSSWINQFRGLKEGDPAGATIGCPPNIGTTQVTPYVFNDDPDLVLWDFPGADTNTFPIESYFTDTNMDRFDAFVMLAQGRFTATDTKLVNLIARTGKHCYFGYTHIDGLIRNGMEDHAKEIRNSLMTFIQKTNITPSQWGSEVFLLTDKLERDMGGWTPGPDNEKLKETILKDLPGLVNKSWINCLCVEGLW